MQKGWFGPDQQLQSHRNVSQSIIDTKTNQSSQSYLFMKKGINQLDEIKFKDLTQAQKGPNWFVISAEMIDVAIGLEHKRVFK